MDELSRQELQAYNDAVRGEQNARDQAVRAAARNQLSDEDRLGRVALNATIARNKVEVAERAAAKVKAEQQRAADKQRAADLDALRLRQELRDGWGGTDQEFAKVYPQLLLDYRQREMIKNVNERRAELRRQIQHWA